MIAKLPHEQRVLLLSGVVTARPVGEQRSCWESEQHLWPSLLPLRCNSALVPFGTCSFGTSDLKQRALFCSMKWFACMQIHGPSLLLLPVLIVCAYKLTPSTGQKLIFEFAQMRKIQSKPISSIKESISSNTKQRALSHIYRRHDNFIEACDVRQIWVG